MKLARNSKIEIKFNGARFCQLKSCYPSSAKYTLSADSREQHCEGQNKEKVVHHSKTTSLQIRQCCHLTTIM